jgi:hypothetical protein
MLVYNRSLNTEFFSVYAIRSLTMVYFEPPFHGGNRGSNPLGDANKSITYEEAHQNVGFPVKDTV